MFDIDGTLIESYDFDSECFTEAVKEVTGLEIDTDWARYKHVTDTGILNEFFNENNIENTNEVTENIKCAFLAKIQNRIDEESINEINGASEFITKLKELDDVVISFATGGWLESAVLKLESAGIDISGIPIASSNDHHSRIEIMKIAEQRAIKESRLSFTYFGDGSWDLKACKELGVNFVLVGDKLEHNQSIKSFEQTSKAFAYIGL
jgi:beta-phosphoglucomutase-like phosphatase (HAD superfamily)